MKSAKIRNMGAIVSTISVSDRASMIEANDRTSKGPNFAAGLHES